MAAHDREVGAHRGSASEGGERSIFLEENRQMATLRSEDPGVRPADRDASPHRKVGEFAVRAVRPLDGQAVDDLGGAQSEVQLGGSLRRSSDGLDAAAAGPVARFEADADPNGRAAG